MVQDPDRSFGSVLAGGLGCIKGFKALISSSSASRAGGGAAAFFPKIFESNVAIVQFSFQGCAMRAGDAHASGIALRHFAGHMNFLVCPRPARVIFLNEHILTC